MRKKLMALFLALMMALSMNLTAFAAGGFADDLVLVGVVGEFGQSEARTMLDMVNALRTGGNAWYWNADDTTKTTLQNLENLTYDYDLEQIAMVRALEIALSYSHTRPNGESWHSLEKDTTSSWAENIAAGYTTAEDVFVGWSEETEKYAKQGHRRNMLNPNFTAIGIGHVEYNGYHYWVQEFGFTNSGAPVTAPMDEEGVSAIEVDPTQVTSLKLDPEDMSPMDVKVGETIELPDTKAYILLKDTWPKRDCMVLTLPEYEV